MLKVKQLVAASLLVLNFSYVGSAFADNQQALIQAVNQYQKAVQAGDVKLAAKGAKKAYQLAQKLLPASDKSLLTITDDYAYLLLKSKQYKQALPVLQQLLTAKEESYGKHSKELLSTLKSIVALTKNQKKLNKEYSVRYQQLALRHYSDKYVEQFKDQPLESTQQAENLAEKIRRVTGKNYQVIDGGKWDFIYNLDSEKDIAPMMKQMEIGYRSAFGFLLAFNVLSKPAEEKFKAVFFETRDDYKKYLHSFKSVNLSEGASRSAGIYIGYPIKSLFLFERQGKNEKRSEFLDLNTLRHEIAHQLFFGLGFHVKGARYPRWLIEGFAESFEFQHANKISGPQTDNINLLIINRIKKLKEDNKFMPLRELVALSNVAQGRGKNTKDIYYTGSMLVRFLYDNYPDKFKKYITEFSKRDSSTGSKRLALFSRNFAEPEALQAEFDAYVANLIETTIAKAKSEKAKKKKKKEKLAKL